MKSDINYQKKEKPSDQLHAQCRDFRHTKYKRFQLAKCFATGGDKLLDVGCETGGLFNGLEERFNSLVGVDVDAEALQFARNLYSGCNNIELIKTDALYFLTQKYPNENLMIGYIEVLYLDMI